MSKEQRKKKQAQAHAAKTGMTYQAAHQQLYGNSGIRKLKGAEKGKLVKIYQKGQTITTLAVYSNPNWMGTIVDGCPSGSEDEVVLKVEIFQEGPEKSQDDSLKPEDQWEVCLTTQAAYDFYKALSKALEGEEGRHVWKGYCVSWEDGYGSVLLSRKGAQKEIREMREWDGRKGLTKPATSTLLINVATSGECFLTGKEAQVAFNITSPRDSRYPSLFLSLETARDMHKGLGYFLGEAVLDSKNWATVVGDHPQDEGHATSLTKKYSSADCGSHYLEMERFVAPNGTRCFFTGEEAVWSLYCYHSPNVDREDNWGNFPLSQRAVEDLHQLLERGLKGEEPGGHRDYNVWVVGDWEPSGEDVYFLDPIATEEEAKIEAELGKWPPPFAQVVRVSLEESNACCFLTHDTDAVLSLQVDRRWHDDWHENLDLDLSREGAEDLVAILGYFLGKRKIPAGFTKQKGYALCHGGASIVHYS